MDIDKNGSIDIDEFVDLLQQGDGIQWKQDNSRKAMLSIKKARKLNAKDFLNAFQYMPKTFIPSFTTEQHSQLRNLPSSAFKPELLGLHYKDINRRFNPRSKQVENKLQIREAEIGGELLLRLATGVPLPDVKDINREKIKGRVVKVSFLDQTVKKLVSNTTFIDAQWRKEYEDRWYFTERNEVGTNPALFKVKNFNKERDLRICFELVIFVP